MNAIAIGGFILSVYNFLYALIRNRKHIQVTFAHIFNVADISDIIHINIINRSTAPICITAVVVTCEGKSGRYGEFRSKITEMTKRSKDTVTEHNAWYSNALPQKIDAGGIFNGLLLSAKQNPVLQPGHDCSVKIYTDKGLVRTSLTLNDFSDLSLLSQCREPD